MIATYQELIDAVKAAQFVADDNPAGQRPLKFFNYGVREIDPRGGLTQTNPNRCATPYTATCLAQLLGPCEVVMGDPENWDGLQFGWKSSELVPYIKFSRDGKTSNPVNAGLIMDYFVHGYPASYVEMCVENEIKGAF